MKLWTDLLDRRAHFRQHAKWTCAGAGEIFPKNSTQASIVSEVLLTTESCEQELKTRGRTKRTNSFHVHVYINI